MEITVKLEIISRTAGNLNLFIEENEEGQYYFAAQSYMKEFSISELEGLSYEPAVFEAEGLEDCHLTEVTIEEKTFLVNIAVESFEEILDQVNLLEDEESEAEVLSISDYIDENEEMVA